VNGPIANAVRREIDPIAEGTFEQHASLEAIDEAMKDADFAQSQIGLHMGWLQDVKRARKEQIAKGEWP
jgi:hypothetical protein